MVKRERVFRVLCHLQLLNIIIRSEQITDATNGFDNLARAQFLTQVADVHVYASVRGIEIATEDAQNEFFTRYDLAWNAKKSMEQFEPMRAFE